MRGSGNARVRIRYNLEVAALTAIQPLKSSFILNLPCNKIVRVGFIHRASFFIPTL